MAWDGTDEKEIVESLDSEQKWRCGVYEFGVIGVTVVVTVFCHSGHIVTRQKVEYCNHNKNKH